MRALLRPRARATDQTTLDRSPTSRRTAKARSTSLKTRVSLDLGMRLHAGWVVLATASVTLAAILAAAPGWSQPAASQLVLRARLNVVLDNAVPCPPGSPVSLVCPAGTGEGVVTGLGAVTETYTVLLHSGPPHVRSEIRQSMPNRQDASRLHGDRHQRQPLGRSVHGHGQALALRSALPRKRSLV
jgi:hypothetical protein